MPDHDQPGAKPFGQFLREQRRGRLHDELSEQLQDVVAAVMKHGKTGALTVKFTVKPQGDGAIEIADAYTAKVPTPPAKASLFFADEQGRMSRERLDQPELPLQGIAGGARAETKTTEAKTA